MILQCGDMERPLRTPELMPDMRAHAESCTRCAEELHLWNEISRVAPQLRQEWDSPFLWQRIQANLREERVPRQAHWWRWAPAACGFMAVIALAVMMMHPWRPAGGSGEHDLLTDRALREVQQTESAYVKSVAKLSALAQAEIDRSASPVASAYREKLALLDAAITDARTAVEQNRYNAYLRGELTSLYQEKQKTLEEWLRNANRN
jgi:hypothetical protein